MKLYVTYTSPYARLARIVVIEKTLEDRVEIVEAKTRTRDSPYYQINPSGRVPYLVDDAGNGVEDSALICAYLDSLDDKPDSPFHLDEPLVDVIIEGNSTIPNPEIAKNIKTRPGRPVTQKQIKDDVEALVRTRWFASVEPTLLHVWTRCDWFNTMVLMI